MKRTTRRDRGSGCVRQRKNGTWEGRVSHGVDRPIVTFYGKTKQDVIEKVRTEQAKPRPDNADQRMTVEGWMTHWLSLVEQNPSITQSTYDVYKHKAEAYINPNIGRHRLSRLTPRHVYELLDKLATDKKGGRTIQVTHAILRRALEAARKRGLISANPAYDVDCPRHKPKERVYLRSLDEIQAFLKEVDESPLRSLFIAGLDTGCRLGELLALRWSDFDERNALLHVRATLTRDSEGKLVATPPKTATSNRTIKLPSSSVEALRGLQRTCPIQRVEPTGYSTTKTASRCGGMASFGLSCGG